MWNNDVLNDFLKDWLDMTDDDVKRKIKAVELVTEKSLFEG